MDHRDKSEIDYAKLEESCLEVVDNKIALKKSQLLLSGSNAAGSYWVFLVWFFSMQHKRLLSAENKFW